MRLQEFRQQEAAIDEALKYGTAIAEGMPERAMVARHVCVLASGFLENIVRTRLSEFARQSRPKQQLAEYLEASVDRFQNPDFDRILEITGRFSSQWRQGLEKIDDAIKSAINSIVSNRHLIAHGRQSGVSFAQISEYVQRAKEFRIQYDKICR